MKNIGLRVALPVAALAMAAGIAAAAVSITAAGATFPYPIYAKWFEEFRKKTGAQINYQSIGSGGGIKQLTEGTVDFGASDKPMSDEQIAKMKIKPLHFPTVMGAVVATYNLPGNPELKFTGPALADIFLGKIKKWNDPAITASNSGVSLPDAPITVVVRADGSGTSFVFTDFLSAVSPEWKSKVGADTAVKWPAGLRAKGNEGVAGMVKQSPNAIGYVELIYAVQNKMGYASVQNADGKFVKPSLESVTSAAAGAAKSMPEDFRVSIVNAPGPNSYPISTFTWLLIPSEISDGEKKKTIKEFLHWMLKDGQKEVTNLTYAPLPKEVIEKEEKQINLIK